MQVAIHLPKDEITFRSNLVDNMRAGFIARGDDVKLICNIADNKTYRSWAQLAVFFGMHDWDLYNWHQRAGHAVLLVDRGYLQPEKYWRLALDGFQSPFMHRLNAKPDRLNGILNDMGWKLKPFNTTPNRVIVYAGPDQTYCNWHKLGPGHEFDSNLIRQLVSKSPIRFSFMWQHQWPNDGRDIYMPRRTSLHEGLKWIPEASVVATHGSRFAIRALIEGIPVVITSKPGVSPLHSICETNLDRVWCPRVPTPEQRLQVLSNIAWCQFTTDEIASGMALETLEPYTFKRVEALKLNNPDNLEYVHAQYKLMHERPNMYRGRLDLDTIEQVKQLVDLTNAKTILDYGSGKGRQYLELKQHELWGVEMPTCYDPGYPPFAKKPVGLFDGVICTDVAEHVPESKVDEFLLTVLSHSDKFAVFVIFTGEAKKSLPDGRNCHLTVQPPEWWISRIRTQLGRSYKTDAQVSENTYEILTTKDERIVVIFRGKEE